MGWREWLIALGLLFMGGLIISTLSIMASAETWVCNGPVCKFRWAPVSHPDFLYYEIEREVEGERNYYGRHTPDLDVPPPDQIGTPFAVRVRACGEGYCGEFGEWSDAVGVPLGWDPDWDQDGLLLPSDFLRWDDAYKGDYRWAK